MRSIAIINQKGGVGKTTTAVNLSAALAEAGHDVCLVDLDPQAHASLHLGVALADDEPSVYDVLAGDVPVTQVKRRVGQRLQLVPAHINLAAAEMELADARGRELILRERLADDDQRCDYLVIDCAPSLGLLTLNALAAVEEVYLPLQPHFLALHGVSKLLQTIEAVAGRMNTRLRLSGVVLCMFDAGTRLANEVAADAESFFSANSKPASPWSSAKVMQTRIRRNIRLAEAPSHGQSILQYDAHSNGADDYRGLAREVLQQRAASGSRKEIPSAA